MSRRPLLITPALPLLVVLAVLAPPAPPARAAEPSDPPPAPAATAHPLDLAGLQARAHAERLAGTRAWLRLGHWRSGWFGGLEGENDAPAFYRSPRGKQDPAAELDATLAGLLTPPPPGSDELDDALCRFPARARFLAASLGFGLGELPPRACPRQQAFLDRVRARSVTLVFSSYYLNNPASSFGHTFLRLDQADSARAGRSQELLDYGVDYSATVDTGNALLYGFKGLFGLFKGTFNHYPYYYKVREYADYESRDLWEYDLALTPDEVTRLQEHLWELGGGWFDYWYLDENCSYHVLGALDAAAPRLGLVDQLGHRPLVIPADTVKTLFRDPGLVRAVHWRPAIRTEFEARVATLSPAALDSVEDLEADPATALPAGVGARDEAAALDAALDLLDLRHAKAMLAGDEPWAAKARQALLVRRAGLRVQLPELALVQPDSLRPERGHGSLRAGLGPGLVRPTAPDRPAGPSVTLDLRLCLHDLADPPDGYPARAQIEFLHLRLRWDEPSGRVELDEASFLRILSLSPVSHFDLRASWQVDAGATTIRDAGCDACTAGQLSGGAGFAATALDGALDAAAFGLVQLQGSAHLEGWGGSPLRVGIGPGGLVRARLGDRATLLAIGSWSWLPEAQPRETWGLDLAARWHLARNLSLALEARRRPSEASLGLVLYVYDRL